MTEWTAQVNDLVGGWIVTTYPHPLSEHFRDAGWFGQVIAECRIEAGARLIADLLSGRDRAEASRRDWAAEATRLSWINESHGAVCLSDELHRRVCACITDEQAAQLDHRFTRPACAVHPQPRAGRVFPVGSPEPTYVLCVRSSVNGVVFQYWPSWGMWRAMESSGGNGCFYDWHRLNAGADGAEMVEVVERAPGAESGGE